MIVSDIITIIPPVVINHEDFNGSKAPTYNRMLLILTMMMVIEGFGECGEGVISNTAQSTTHHIQYMNSSQQSVFTTHRKWLRY